MTLAEINSDIESLASFDVAKCFRLGGPFADFALHLTDSNTNLILAPALPILLINVPIALLLSALALLCDKEQLIKKRRNRANLTSIKIGEHAAAYNRKEILQANQTTLHNHGLLRGYTSTDIEKGRPDNIPFTRWREAYITTTQELSMQESRVQAAENALKDLTVKSWTEVFYDVLSRPTSSSLILKRYITLTIGLLLFLALFAPLTLGPYVIFAHQYCDRYTPPHEHLTTAFWIIYAVCTVLPALVAIRLGVMSLWHWFREPCMDCIEEPNVHSEHVAAAAASMNGTGGRDWRGGSWVSSSGSADSAKEGLRKERGYSDSSSSSGYSPVSPTTPAGGHCWMGGLPKIEEECESEKGGHMETVRAKKEDWWVRRKVDIGGELGPKNEDGNEIGVAR